MGRYSINAEVCTIEGTLPRRILAKLGGTKKLYTIENDYAMKDMREQFTRRYARALRDEAAQRSGLTLPAPAKESWPQESSPVAEDAPLPLEGARGKTVDFLQMARKVGVNVSLPTDLPLDPTLN